MPDAHEQFSEAVDLAELGRYEEALALFRVLLKTDSNNATIWNNIGIIRFRQGDYRDAVNAFGQAADIDPAWSEALFNKSLALVHLGKPRSRNPPASPAPSLYQDIFLVLPSECEQIRSFQRSFLPVSDNQRSKWPDRKITGTVFGETGTLGHDPEKCPG